MDKDFENVVAFHGHLCMDIALGYRVAKAAMRALSCQRPRDEELVAVVENDSCSVDAVQAITGCTFGKGNLVYRPYGKAAYTFYDRNSDQAVRIYCHFWMNFDKGEGEAFMNQMNRTLNGEATQGEIQNFQRLMEDLSNRILAAPESELFTITHLKQEPPPSARIFKSTACEGCGEWTMEIRLSRKDGKLLCPPCYQAP
jgi:formylmethanofuran dehydrogenase subunit E